MYPGFTSPSFSASGKIPKINDKFINCASGLASSFLLSLSSLVGMLLGPIALLLLRFFVTFRFDSGTVLTVYN